MNSDKSSTHITLGTLGGSTVDMKPKVGQWHASPDTGQMSFIVQTVQLGYYCYLSIRLAFINEKSSHWKITMTPIEESIYWKQFSKKGKKKS